VNVNSIWKESRELVQARGYFQ